VARHRSWHCPGALSHKDENTMPEESVIELQPHDDVLLLAVTKRTLDEGAVRSLSDEIYTAAAARTGVPIVLDLQAVRFAPSVALGTLVQLSKSFKLDGRRIAMIGVHERVRQAIGVTRLDRVLEIHNSLEQVLRGKS